MATYVIARVANKNPAINGRKLYLTSTGLWTLNPSEARKFQSEDIAKLWASNDEHVEEQPQ